METLTKDMIKEAYEKTGLKPRIGSVYVLDNCVCPIGALFKYKTSKDVDRDDTNDIYDWFDENYGNATSFWRGFDSDMSLEDYLQYDRIDSVDMFNLGRELRQELLTDIN